MSAHKSIDKICAVIAALTLMLTVLFCCGQAFGIETTVHAIGYENRLFDRSRVHTLDIEIEDWEGFLETCESEAYSPCSVIIDGEAVKNAGIRGKGNTSLSSVKNMNSSRYSFKIEFDQYDSTKSYHGLDKLCLNNIIQDNTYMKDYLAYSLMYDFGVDAPLCSFSYLTVNGEDWGLYLAVEAIEEAFLERNYGSNFGDLYKPDAMGFGGGRGNGKDFRMSEFMEQGGENADNADMTDPSARSGNRPGGGRPDFGEKMPDFGGEMPDFGNGAMPPFDPENIPEGFDPSALFGKEGGMPDFGSKKGALGGGRGMGSDDVKLKYIDDEISSYSNIFNNAKTTVNTTDQKRLIAALKALSEQNDLENTLDTEEVLRYFVVHIFLNNGDSYTGQMIHNYYLYEKDGRLSMIPWDYNLAYGSFMGADASSAVNSPLDTPVSGGMTDRPMIAWIFDDPEYTAQYHALFSEFLNSVDLENMVTETAVLIDEYVKKDPTKFCTYEEFQKGVTAMCQFCTLREESIRGQLDGTIPATSDGQNADKTALIDTGSLSISDMGTMSGGFGGGKFGRPGKTEQTDTANITGATEKEPRDFPNGQINASTLPFNRFNVLDSQEVAEQPDFGGNRPDFGGQPPQGFDPDHMPEGFDRGNAPEGFDSGNAPGQQNGEFTPKEDSSAANSEPEQSAPDYGQSPNGAQNTPDTAGKPVVSEDERLPMGFSGMNSSTPADHTTAYILLGLSATALIFGLGFALRFKR